MTDYERFLPDRERRHDPPRRRQHDHDKDRGAMVRTIIQGLILAGVVGLVGMVIEQGRQQAISDSVNRIQIATLQSQVAEVQKALAGIPDLSQRTTRLETNQAELMRRMNVIDAWRDRLQTDNPKMKGWTR